MRGTLFGIGVGPGDPELITFKAARILKEVSLVAVPVAEQDKQSTAYRIAERFIRPECRVMEIEFPMTRNRGSLEEAWREARAVVQNSLDEGCPTAFLTLGDPMLYSTYIYLFHHLKAAGYAVETVPGISSFNAAAAAAGVPLAFGDEKLIIVPGSEAAQMSPSEMGAFQTLVIFKVARCYDQIVAALKKSGRLEESVLIMSCGMPGERIVSNLEAVAGPELSYFSLIISRKEPVW